MAVVTKPIVQTRTMTRIDCMELHAERFLKITEAFGCNIDFYTEKERLRTMLRLELVSRFEIVVQDHDKPIGGLEIVIDWQRYTFNLSNHGEDIDVSRLADGELFQDAEACFEMSTRYILSLWNACDRPNIRTWWSITDEALTRFGSLENIRNMLFTSRTPEEDAERLARLEVLHSAKARSADTQFSFHELDEMSTSGWRKS